ncbi:hypothetical protein NQ317_004192 [Molorchus minor]|uniref:CCHC-type domain-containing protein n=1 Tax=Molorchus minor TaxID=1323400 RepID=A0ABQ9JDM7_9CUCU|nr:hypothetical protein NQ317_004192 [Molorchus minor]
MDYTAAQYLELIEQSTSNKNAERRKGLTRGFLATGDNNNVANCVLCKKQHYIQNCPEFLNLNASERFERIKSLKICLNCLRGGHFSKNCRRGTCRKCKSKHHTLLHADIEGVTNSVASNSSDSGLSNPGIASIRTEGNTNALSASGLTDHVLLSTAYVNVLDKKGKVVTVRALLDSGAQSNFISRDLCLKLGISTERANLTVTGLNQSISSIELKCKVLISFAYCYIHCFVLPQITGILPNVKININNIAIPSNIKLADPTFAEPGKIDLLIGAELFWQLICNGQISLGSNKPVLQKTRFGWIVSGPVGGTSVKCVACNFSQNIDKEIQTQLSKFWEIEECPRKRVFSEEELACENHFVENTERTQEGRFIVALPLKEKPEILSDSYDQAEKRFLSLERTWLKK